MQICLEFSSCKIKEVDWLQVHRKAFTVLNLYKTFCYTAFFTQEM